MTQIGLLVGWALAQQNYRWAKAQPTVPQD